MKVFLLICLFLGGGFLFMKSGYLSQCNDKTMQKKIDRLYNKLPDTAEGRTFLKEIDMQLQRTKMRESEKEGFAKASLELTVRKDKNCKIPEELRRRVTDSIMPTRVGGVTCVANKYTGSAKRTYAKVKADPGYPQFEQQARAEFFKNITNAKARTLVSQKWEDPSFRESVLIAVFDMDFRSKNNCKNVALPMASIMEDIMQ